MSREEKLLFAKEKLKQFQKQKKLNEGQPPRPAQPLNPPQNGKHIQIAQQPHNPPQPQNENIQPPYNPPPPKNKESSQYLHSLTEEYARKNEDLYKELVKANNKISELKEINSRLETAKSMENANNMAQMAAEENYIRTVGDLVAEKTELLTKLSLSETRLESTQSTFQHIAGQLHSANIKARITEQNLSALSESHKRICQENEFFKSTRSDQEQQLDSLQSELKALREKTFLSDKDVETLRTNLHRKVAYSLAQSLQIVQYEAEIKSLQSQVTDFVNTCSRVPPTEQPDLQDQLDSLRFENSAQLERIKELTSLLSAERSSFLLECSQLRERQVELENELGDYRGVKSQLEEKVSQFDELSGKYGHTLGCLRKMEDRLRQFVLEVGLVDHNSSELNVEDSIALIREALMGGDSEEMMRRCEQLQKEKSKDTLELEGQVRILKEQIDDLEKYVECKQVSGEEVERLSRIVEDLESQNKAISSYVVLYREQRHVLNHKVMAKDAVIEEQKRESGELRGKLSKIRFLVKSLQNRSDVNVETANSILDECGGGEEGKVRTDEVVQEISEIVKVCDVVDKIPIERLCKDCKGPIYIA